MTADELRQLYQLGGVDNATLAAEIMERLDEIIKELRRSNEVLP